MFFSILFSHIRDSYAFSDFFVSPGHHRTIQNLIPGWTTIVKLLKQVKNWQSPSWDPWSNCLINSQEDDKGQTYYSGRQEDNSKTIQRQFADTAGIRETWCGVYAQRTQAHHSKRENLMRSSSRDLDVSGKLDAVFSCHSESNQNTYSERDRSEEPGNRFESSVHSVLRFANPASVGNHFMMGTRII